ncbi:nitronate monooxygenase [Mariniluteicoccus endophyticus]
MSRFPLPELDVPIIAAPMAGGPSTPELVAAVANAGGFGFLAGGFLSVDQLKDRISRTGELTWRPFGVNLFVTERAEPRDLDGFRAQVEAYAATRPSLAGVEVGEPAWDRDDDYRAKVHLVAEEEPVAAVSFTFGLPTAQDVEKLHSTGTCVMVTVTSPDEARAALEVGADALTVQGPKAGGHRGTHDMTAEPGDTDLLDLLDEIGPLGLPMAAAGGLATSETIAEALAHGAVAAQLGSIFLLTPEAGTSVAHRAALRKKRDTVSSRSFTGRYARGLANGWTEAIPDAPAVYPQVHQMTSALRQAAAAAGDIEATHLWAGTEYRRAVEAPAADIIRLLAAEL